MDYYLPVEVGLELTYQDRFDKEDLGVTTLKVQNVLKKGSELELVLEKLQSEDFEDDEEPEVSQERYLLTPTGAYRLPKKQLQWAYPVENREWVEEHPAGPIRCQMRILDTYKLKGREYKRAMEIKRSGTLGNSTSVYDPQLGLLYASYMAGGTPGETLLVKVRRSKA